MSGGNHPHGDCRDCATQRAEIKRTCEERDSAQRCIEKLTAEITALRAEVDRLHTQRGDDAQQLIDFAATLAIAEEDASWDALRARVAALEAVVRAAREYRAEIADARGDHPGIREWKRKQDALDAALAAVEVNRG